MNEQAETVNEIVMTEEQMAKELAEYKVMAEKLAETGTRATAEVVDLRVTVRRQRAELAAFADRVKTLENNTDFALHVLEAADTCVLSAREMAGVLRLVKKALSTGYEFNIAGEIPF